MKLTPDQLARAADAVVEALGLADDEGVHVPDAPAAAQAVADALWPGFIGQPRRPLPTGYRVEVVPDDRGDQPAWTWTVTTDDGTLVATGGPSASRDGAAFLGRVVLGLDDVT